MQSKSMNARLEDFLVCSYSRAEMIEDGEMIDVSETARLLGFRFPVGMTLSVWANCVAWDEADAERTGSTQSESVRLWDVLDDLKTHIRGAGSDRIEYHQSHVSRRGNSAIPTTTKIVAVCGPGDNAEPVITLMFPGED